MSKLRVQCFSLSIEGFGAGPNQDLDNPIGVGGLAMMDWMRSTRTFQKMYGSENGATGINDDFAVRGFANVGAWILGRNMFGPIRGPWRDDEWKGWWGKNPPYHVPVFVLTHHARPSITMEGHLLGGIDLKKLGYECTEHVPTEQATHVVLTRKHNR